jgi:uncharacterized damage-inducible protein DinB
MESAHAKEVTMSTRLTLTQHLLDHAFATLADNLTNLTLDEALFLPHRGFRSVLGTLKHAAAWSHVYRSYAFDAEPTAWHALDWPYGLRDTIIPSQAYLDAVIGWLFSAHARWQHALVQVPDQDLDAARPVHWGVSMPLYEIVVIIAHHHVYHAGEINQLLAIARGEAWEEGEEVEENHVSTAGHRVVPAWKHEQSDPVE